MLRATIHFSPLPCSDLQEHDEQGEQTSCLTSCLFALVSHHCNPGLIDQITRSVDMYRQVEDGAANHHAQPHLY